MAVIMAGARRRLEIQARLEETQVSLSSEASQLPTPNPLSTSTPMEGPNPNPQPQPPCPWKVAHLEKSFELEASALRGRVAAGLLTLHGSRRLRAAMLGLVRAWALAARRATTAEQKAAYTSRLKHIETLQKSLAASLAAQKHRQGIKLLRGTIGAMQREALAVQVRVWWRRMELQLQADTRREMQQALQARRWTQTRTLTLTPALIGGTGRG